MPHLVRVADAGGRGQGAGGVAAVVWQLANITIN